MSEEEHLPQDAETTETEAVDKGGKFGLIVLSIFILTLVGGLIAMLFIPEKLKLIELVDSGEWYAKNIGSYHPLVLHLPIGIVFLTVTMEVFGWLSFGKYKPRTAVGLFFAVITGTIACVTGFVSMHMGWSPDDEKWVEHMQFGVAFVGVLALAFLAKVWGNRNGSRGPIYAILLFGAAGLMGLGAHIGGEKVHKSDPVEGTLIGLGLIEGEGEAAADEPQAAKPLEERLAYADVVVPILETNCLYCHSEEEKVRGGLEMDTFENLLFGGESQEDGKHTLIPGDASKSFMIEVIELPEDDDLHMPPAKKGRKQVEAHELAILKWWINGLPKDSKTLEDKSLADLNAPAEILEAASKLVSPEEQAAIAAELKKKKAEAEAAAKAKREKLEGSLNALKQEDVFKNSLMYASQDSTDLEFTAVSLRKNLKDEDFVKLGPVAEALTTVKLGSSSITEATLMRELPRMKHLKKLDLSQMEIGDNLMDTVGGIESLEWLNIYGTQVSDAGLAKLKGLKNLKKIYLWNSKATPKGAEVLKKDLKDLEFFFGSN